MSAALTVTRCVEWADVPPNLLAIPCETVSQDGPGGSIDETVMELHSPASAPGARIPRRHTCHGEYLSPPVSWSGAPQAASLVLLCEDPDAPSGTFHHWALYDLPAETTDLAEGQPAKARVGAIRQAVKDFGRPGYGGPCPPRGHGTHHYHVRLLALDVPSLGLADTARCRDVARAARLHVLAEATLAGTCAR
jgi:Raf kinase inhibitor-like YbhB/YbcL family protein